MKPGRKHKLPSRQRREVARRLASGERRRALAAEFGVSYGIVGCLDRQRPEHQRKRLFRGLPTPAMQAWLRAEQWGPAQLVWPNAVEILHPITVMSAAPPSWPVKRKSAGACA
jgi:hypothetical protein